MSRDTDRLPARSAGMHPDKTAVIDGDASSIHAKFRVAPIAWVKEPVAAVRGRPRLSALLVLEVGLHKSVLVHDARRTGENDRTLREEDDVVSEFQSLVHVLLHEQ